MHSDFFASLRWSNSEHSVTLLCIFVSPIQVTGRGLAPAGLSWSLLERLTGGDQLYKHEKLEKVGYSRMSGNYIRSVSREREIHLQEQQISAVVPH